MPKSNKILYLLFNKNTMYLHKKHNSTQLTGLIKHENRWHNLSEELKITLNFLNGTSTSMGEDINTLAHKIHDRLPFSTIDITPGYAEAAGVLYHITFSNLYDVNLVDDGKSALMGDVHVYLGSFITYGEENNSTVCSTRPVSHAVLIDGNNDKYDFEKWKECLHFLFKKYSKTSVEVAKRFRIDPIK
jgi:hypothetical protein